MLRTTVVSLLVVLCGWMAAAWLTHGFEVWTQEGARRLEVALNPVPAPPVAIDGPTIRSPALPQLLRSHGGVTVVDFMYTHCQTVCLALGSGFQQMQAEMERDPLPDGNAGVRLLSISFDGARDDPATLAAYGKRFNADPVWWHFIRVPDATQQQALLRDFGITVIPNGRGDFEHNAAYLIFDQNGRMVRIFDLAERELALNYARHLAKTQGARTAAVTPGAQAASAAAAAHAS